MEQNYNDIKLRELNGNKEYLESEIESKNQMLTAYKYTINSIPNISNEEKEKLITDYEKHLNLSLDNTLKTKEYIENNYKNEKGWIDMNVNDLTEEQNKIIEELMNSNFFKNSTEEYKKNYMEYMIKTYQNENKIIKEEKLPIQEINHSFPYNGESTPLQDSIADKVLTAENFDYVMNARIKVGEHEPVNYQTPTPEWFEFRERFRKENPGKDIKWLNDTQKELLSNPDEKVRQYIMDRVQKEYDERKNEGPRNYDPMEDKYSELSTDLDSIEDKLDSCDELDEDQVTNLKDKLKEFENRLKEKIKPKTITITSSLHNKIKNYCNKHNEKIGDWVDKILKTELEKPRLTHYEEEQKKEEMEKEAILKRYFDSKKTHKLIKSDKIIALHNFKFIGHSQLDHKPVYDYLGSEAQLKTDLNRIGCNVNVVFNEILTPDFLASFEEMDLDLGKSLDNLWDALETEKKYCYCGAESCYEEPGFDLCHEHIQDV